MAHLKNVKNQKAQYLQTFRQFCNCKSASFVIRLMCIANNFRLGEQV